jgi:NADP-dependent 3-hydroxy acid dehydrogenase YdfG
MFNRFVNMEERQHGVRSTVIVLGTTDTPAQHRGPVPARQEAQATWMRPEDIAQVVVMIATLPHRATVEEIEIRPTDPSYILPGWRYLGAEPV